MYSISISYEALLSSTLIHVMYEYFFSELFTIGDQYGSCDYCYRMNIVFYNGNTSFRLNLK